MVHRVNIQVPNNYKANDLNELNQGRWFKQTTEFNGVKTTDIFRRDNKPRSIGQKIMDFFSGVKKAKDSITLADAFQCIQKNTLAGSNARFDTSLIHTAIGKLDPQANRNAPAHLASPGGHYQVSAERNEA